MTENSLRSGGESLSGCHTAKVPMAVTGSLGRMAEPSENEFGVLGAFSVTGVILSNVGMSKVGPLCPARTWEA